MTNLLIRILLFLNFNNSKVINCKLFIIIPCVLHSLIVTPPLGALRISWYCIPYKGILPPTHTHTHTHTHTKKRGFWVWHEIAFNAEVPTIVVVPVNWSIGLKIIYLIGPGEKIVIRFLGIIRIRIFFKLISLNHRWDPNWHYNSRLKWTWD